MAHYKSLNMNPQCLSVDVAILRSSRYPQRTASARFCSGRSNEMHAQRASDDARRQASLCHFKRSDVGDFLL